MQTPTRITVAKDKQSIEVQFSDSHSHSFTAEILRVLSPSAEVQGHSEAERKLVGGKKNVSVSNIEPVGNYAIRIIFSDGHDTGLFSWAFLAELAANYEERYEAYIKEIESASLTREA